MNDIKIMMLSKRKIKRGFFITTASIITIYLLVSFYFINHFFFSTEINGVNVSLISHDKASDIFQSFTNDYKLQLLERNSETEIITGHDIGLYFNRNFDLSQLHSMQNPFLWIGALFKKHSYYLDHLYVFDQGLLTNKINRLHCLNKDTTEPHSPTFLYSDGSYIVTKERYGDRINLVQLSNAVIQSILHGDAKLDLNKKDCYVNPLYTLHSKKTSMTRSLLNSYVSAKIIYHFGNVSEQVDSSLIHQWLSVDNNLDITIDKDRIANYIRALSKKYDTVGIPREFHTSTGTNIIVNGGLYGWKINRELETNALYQHIIRGDIMDKEPEYVQKALSREGNEIGNTYIEINISRQHVWFYKNGKLLVQGAVVTGNPNRGNATVLGVYMINYKQRNATLVGENYSSKVTYWMPFFGNMGLHDASWRSSFGGKIYLSRGSHGCVNAPLYLAKIVYENSTPGTPIIVYEEN